MRPIDGDVLEEAFEQLADKLRHDGQKTDAQLLEALAAIVKFCPTLDVEPIRHGFWDVNAAGYLECSPCAEFAPFNDEGVQVKPKRCPGCGAYMDEMDEAPAVGSPAVDTPTVDTPAVDSAAVDKGADADGT